MLKAEACLFQFHYPEKKNVCYMLIVKFYKDYLLFKKKNVKDNALNRNVLIYITTKTVHILCFFNGFRKLMNFRRFLDYRLLNRRYSDQCYSIINMYT